MDQFVLVPDTVYNKSLITQSVTKQDFPKYQPSQNHTYQIDSLKKEINKKLFSKADSLVDKILSCSRIKLSNSKTLILGGVETRIFLSDFAQQLPLKNADVPDIYFILLDAAGISTTHMLNQNAKAVVYKKAYDTRRAGRILVRHQPLNKIIKIQIIGCTIIQ